jgi:NADH:ubiquinone oxidoreductase subunit
MSLFGPITKTIRAVKERGWKGLAIQLYLISDIKFGELKGTDKFGNKYYEDLDLPYGQHRWVEYSNIHNYDATMIQPEWHGWMHHVFDETPDEQMKKDELQTTSVSNSIYTTHLAMIGEAKVAQEQVDTSQYRQRGYKVGSLMIGEDDKDNYYKQPGHPLSKKEGRFKETKDINGWTPDM